MELISGACDEVTPVEPTVTQAACRSGGIEPAAGDVRDDRWGHVTEDLRRPYLPLPMVVTVTARDGGRGWLAGDDG